LDVDRNRPKSNVIAMLILPPLPCQAPTERTGHMPGGRPVRQCDHCEASAGPARFLSAERLVRGVTGAPNLGPDGFRGISSTRISIRLPILMKKTNFTAEQIPLALQPGFQNAPGCATTGCRSFDSRQSLGRFRWPPGKASPAWLDWPGARRPEVTGLMV
jgi:hypothetical protein